MLAKLASRPYGKSQVSPKLCAPMILLEKLKLCKARNRNIGYSLKGVERCHTRVSPKGARVFVSSGIFRFQQVICVYLAPSPLIKHSCAFLCTVQYIISHRHLLARHPSHLAHPLLYCTSRVSRLGRLNLGPTLDASKA